MRILLGAAVICLLNVAAWGADAMPDGEFTVKVQPSPQNKLKNTTKPYDDVLIIKGGRMSTKVSSGYGFPDGPCTLKTEGGRKLVVCEMKDDVHGSNLFTLEIRGKAVAGTLKWSKVGEDGKPKSAEYTVSGAIK